MVPGLAVALALGGCTGDDTARTVTVDRTVTVTPDGRPYAAPGVGDFGDDGLPDPAVPARPAPAEPAADGDDGVPDPDAGPLPLEPGGAARVLGAVRERVGTMPQFTSINLYGTYAVLYVRDPGAPGNVDRYVWRDGRVGDPEPVRIQRERVGPAAFRPAEVNLGRVPALVARGRRVPIELPSVCCVLIARQVPFRKDIVMTVPVSGTRETATLLADAGGTVRRIVR